MFTSAYSPETQPVEIINNYLKDKRNTIEFIRNKKAPQVKGMTELRTYTEKVYLAA
jgi:hypothetical protein